ncbi:MAG: SsrA-binding protein SmpB [Bernardetiaceae bacterium]|jgi:SsrA-binding protein|nr:SsrA-binding protein SmpB [Bernardetiaceae bacterium]
MAKLKDKIVQDLHIRNRRASFEYQFLDKYTAGICLKGTEIKSLRLGKVNVDDAYCLFVGDELFVRNLHINEYEKGTRFNHDPKADRKLLLTRRELRKLAQALKNVGLTIVPTHIFISDRGFAKVDIALAKGKKLHDKRESIKERDVKRDLERGD